jgi:hypothetical protein
MADPTSVIGLVLRALTTIVDLIARRRRADAAPNIVISTPLKPNQASEPWREWLHLSVENVQRAGASETRSADARVFGQLDDEPERPLFWSVGYRGELRTALDAGVPVPVPIAIRDSKSGTPVYNNTLEPGVAYLTDWQFVQRAPRKLAAKRYRLRVRVQYDQAAERTAEFYLTVGRDSGTPLELSRSV